MALKSSDIQKLARILDEATSDAREIERLTTLFPDLSLNDAYLVQEEGIRIRLGRGERPVGFKMGLTSKAKREQVGLHSPIYGVLTDRTQIANGAKFSLRGSIHPKIEPEIGFLIGKDLKGRVSRDEALAACKGVCAALEIIDSRFKGFKYFSLPDVVADNCSSSRFILGDLKPISSDLNLERLEMVMEVDGAPTQTALSDAISGHPADSLVQLCELSNSRGLSLKAGSIVLAGGATQAVELKPDTKARLKVQGLGEVHVYIERESIRTLGES